MNEIKELRYRVLANRAFKVGVVDLGFTENQVTDLLGDRETLHIEGMKQASQEAERALSILVIYRCLKSLLGKDPQAMKHWMATSNQAFGRSPLETIVDDPDAGLVAVRDYLERMESSGW